MKYRGNEIGIPTLEMIEEYVIRKRLNVSPYDIYSHYRKLGWRTKNGRPILTLEGIVNAAHSVEIQRKRRSGELPPKEEKNYTFFEHKTSVKTFQEYVAYTDGSCDNLDPRRPGGSAYIIFNEDGSLFLKSSKGFLGTTNNRMEMLAIISVVNALPRGSRVTIHTDSDYCIKALKSRNPKKNLDLIAKYHRLANGLDVEFVWVKGHSGNIYNEECDRMANSEFLKMR